MNRGKSAPAQIGFGKSFLPVSTNQTGKVIEKSENHSEWKKENKVVENLHYLIVRLITGLTNPDIVGLVSRQLRKRPA